MRERSFVNLFAAMPHNRYIQIYACIVAAVYSVGVSVTVFYADRFCLSGIELEVVITVMYSVVACHQISEPV